MSEECKTSTIARSHNVSTLRNNCNLDNEGSHGNNSGQNNRG